MAPADQPHPGLGALLDVDRLLGLGRTQGEPARLLQGRRQQLHQRQRGGRLAAAGLAGEAERLARLEVEVDAVDDRMPFVRDPQVADLEKGAHRCSRRRGLTCSSSMYPRIETASTRTVMQRPGGITYHQAPGARGPGVEGVLEHRAPGDPGRVAEPEEGERRLGEDRDGDDQHRVGEDQRQRVGEDVGADDVGVAGPQGTGALDEGALAQREDLGADDPPGAGPGGEPDDRDQHPQRGVQQPGEDDHQRQGRDHQEPVLQRVEDAVGPAAEVAAGQAHRRPQHRRDHRRREADDDRDLRPDQQLREDVGAELGRPQRVIGADPLQHLEAGGVGIVGRDRAAEDRHQDEQPDHAEADPPAPGVQEELADAALGGRTARRGDHGRPRVGRCLHLGHFDCTLGSR